MPTAELERTKVRMRFVLNLDKKPRFELVKESDFAGLLPLVACLGNVFLDQSIVERLPLSELCLT